jgi:hypothetical protein
MLSWVLLLLVGGAYAAAFSFVYVARLTRKLLTTLSPIFQSYQTLLSLTRVTVFVIFLPLSLSVVYVSPVSIVMVVFLWLVAYASPYGGQSHMASVTFGQCRIITLTIQRQCPKVGT